MNEDEKKTLETENIEPDSIEDIEPMEEGKQEGKKSHKKMWIILPSILLSVLILMLIAGIGVSCYIRNLYEKTNYEDDSTIEISIDSSAEAEMDEQYKDITLTPPSSRGEEEGEEGEEEKTTVPPATISPEVEQADVDSILLIGVDRRERNWNGNSDVMMLATINHSQKKVYLTSFLRDLYADEDGFGVRRLNHAYAVGGGPHCVDTITKNYGVRIDNYISIDFLDFVHIVDRLGGVDIYVTGAEAKWVNSYLEEINTIQGRPKTTDSLPLQDGTYHLTGSSALAYCRIRYIGYDFGRTQRQRTVLLACLDKVKAMSISEINSLLNDIMPYFSHNIDQNKVNDLIAKVPQCLGYEFVQMQVPADGEYNIQEQILVPNDINALRNKLQSILYSK